jgi:molecular chaperone IbpA
MFGLGEHMEVQSANFIDGLLSITVIRNIPEEKKPRVIEIQ